jgi:hypothetical protein
MLVYAVAAELVRGGVAVRLPAVYNGNPQANTGGSILQDVIALTTLNSEAETHIKHHDAEAQKLAQTDAAKAALHAKARDAWKRASAFYDVFLGKLTAADDKGNILFASVVREAALAERLAAGDALLLVKLHKAGGAYYTKKNMLTSLVGVPLYNKGAVVTSFIVLDGRTANVLASGLVPVDSGFVKMDLRAARERTAEE